MKDAAHAQRQRVVRIRQDPEVFQLNYRVAVGQVGYYVCDVRPSQAVLRGNDYEVKNADDDIRYCARRLPTLAVY